MDRQRLIRNGLIGVVVLAGVTVSLGYARHLMRVDPFAKFDRRQPGPKDVFARMNDVDMRQYKAGQLIGQAHVGELAMRNDRETFDLTNVYDGVLYTDEGKIDFRADEATWDAGKLQLAVNSGAHVANKDFDLRVPSFTVDQRSGKLQIKREIRGKFFGGQIGAIGLQYDLNSGTGKVGPSTWVGKVNMKQDTGQAGPPTKWSFKSGGLTFYKNNLEIWQNSQATDGEVVVQGDEITRNTKTDVITATGNCLYFSAKANVACDKVVVYRKEKRAVLSGSVRMLIKPKDSMERKLVVGSGEIPPFRPVVPDGVAAQGGSSESAEDKALDDEIRSGKTIRKYPVAILATHVDYWYGKGSRHAIVTGSPQASQQLAGTRWRKAWADKVLYDGEKETLRMVSSEGKDDVRVKSSKGDDITADWFEFSTKEGDDGWSGSRMKGDVMADEDEDLKDAKGETPKTDNVLPPPDKKDDGKPPVTPPVKKEEAKPPVATPTDTKKDEKPPAKP